MAVAVMLPPVSFAFVVSRIVIVTPIRRGAMITLEHSHCMTDFKGVIFRIIVAICLNTDQLLTIITALTDLRSEIRERRNHIHLMIPERSHGEAALAIIVRHQFH